MIGEEKSVLVTDSFVCIVGLFLRGLLITITHTDELMLKVDNFIMVAPMLSLCFPLYLNSCTRYW